MELIWGLIPLILGPVLFRAGQRIPAAVLVLDGFTFVAIGGLVLAEVLPQAFGLAGWLAIPAAIIGFAGPTLAERGRSRIGKQAHSLALVLALVGLLVHGFVDGMALAPGVISSEGGNALMLAVVLHRLPVALTIWWLLQPRGTSIATGVLVALGVSTVAGYFLAESVVQEYLKTRWVGVFEALVGGSLLHVVAHSSIPLGVSESPGRLRWASTFGVVLALVVLLAVGHGHDHSHGHGHGLASNAGTEAAPSPPENPHVASRLRTLGDGKHDHGPTFRDRFIALALASAPALLLGYLAAGLIQAFLPKGSVGWMRRGSRAGQSMRGVLFGLPLPICSCGVIPVYRSLIQKGAPLTAALALLVSAPELSLDAVLLTVPLLGADFAWVRVAAAALVAVLIGWWVGRLETPSESAANSAPNDDEAAAPAWTRLGQGLKVGLGEMVDHTGPWILFGLLVAAAAQPLLADEWLAKIPSYLEIPLFALLGMPVYVCASGATPLAAVLVLGGVSPGAALAFLITGPATNVTTFGILKQLHGPQIALRFALGVAALAVACGFVTNALIDAVPTRPFDHHHAGNFLEWGAMVALTLLFIVSVLRQGARSFVGEILKFPSGDDEPEHAHCHHS